jgi:hypothetical protein
MPFIHIFIGHTTIYVIPDSIYKHLIDNIDKIENYENTRILSGECEGVSCMEDSYLNCELNDLYELMI